MPNRRRTVKGRGMSLRSCVRRPFRMTDIDYQRALVGVLEAGREQGRVSVFARTQRLVAGAGAEF